MFQASWLGLPLQGGGIVPRGTRVEVFSQIYWVFIALGTVVGIVVIAYMLYNAYKYRDDGGEEADGAERPTLGEMPTGGGKGGKLFLSFSLSAIIVISLIVWTYGTLLYVEQDSPEPPENTLDINVEGYQFGWAFTYPNGSTERGTLRIPEDTAIRITVTSRDVFHNFGIPAMRVKSDAIPEETTETWFIANETGNYTAKCYELCGVGHSQMTAEVVVMEEDAYQEWYANTTAPNGSDSGNASGNASGGGGGGHGSLGAPA